MSENKDKKINLLKQMKDEGLITEQEYNEKIAIVEKEENKITKQTTTKNNKKAKEKDASQNSEQATEEKELGFWEQIRQIKENKGCFWGMNAIECFLYSTIVFFASLNVMFIIPKTLNALMYGSIMVVVSLIQSIILYSYNKEEIIEYYQKNSFQELFSTVFPQIKGNLSYAALIMIGFIIFCFVAYGESNKLPQPIQQFIKEQVIQFKYSGIEEIADCLEDNLPKHFSRKLKTTKFTPTQNKYGTDAYTRGAEREAFMYNVMSEVLVYCRKKSESNYKGSGTSF